MPNSLRRSGIDAVGDIPWGTHFCHFYANKTDLLDVLVPYFKAGLEQHEFCVWEVFDPLERHEAKTALALALPGAGARLAAGDIEILPRQPARHWEEKLEKALAKGYAGMRVNANGAWLAEADPRSPDAYQDAFSGLIVNRPMILLCAYPLTVHDAGEVLSAGHTHRCAIARPNGNWQVVETPELRQAGRDVRRLRLELERNGIERAGELAAATAARDCAEQALRVCKERSQCYFELGLVGMAILSPAKGCLEVNQRLCEILGYERGELMRVAWAALIHPDDLEGEIRSYERFRAGEVDGYLQAKRWIHKTGNIVYTNMSVKCQRREDGSVDYFAVMVEEIFRGESTPVHPQLSRRERDVARLIGLGRTVKEVAAALALSEKTVSTYRARILTKLKLKSTAELIRYALKHGLSE